MSEIAYRLRTHAAYRLTSKTDSVLMIDAAVRIEQLEACLADVVKSIELGESQ